MPLSDHYKGGLTERLLVNIVTVDPANNRIEVVGKDAAIIQINVSRTPMLFRWPIQGETWTIIRENGDWSIEAKVSGPDEKQVATMAPGEALVQANTIWTPDGEKVIRTGDAAGGVLAGAYPNPTFAADMSTQAELDAEAATRLAADNALTARINEFDALPANAEFLAEAQGSYGAGTAAQSVWVAEAGGVQFASGALSATSPALLKWSASEWARTGKTTQWWMHGYAYTNSGTFGTITYAIGLRRFSVGGATGGIAYTMFSPDAEARVINFVNPTGGASTPAPAVLTPPADSNYGAYISNSATTGANSWIAMKMRLYVYWV